MGGSSSICPGADPDSAHIVEFRSFVAWFKATLDRRDRLSSPTPHSFDDQQCSSALTSSY